MRCLQPEIFDARPAGCRDPRGLKVEECHDDPSDLPEHRVLPQLFPCPQTPSMVPTTSHYQLTFCYTQVNSAWPSLRG